MLLSIKLRSNNYTTPWSGILLEKLIVTSWSRNSLPSMKPRGLLLCLQELATGHFPQPDESSSSHPHTHYLRCVLILSSYL